MNINKTEMITGIITLPRRFHSLGNKSIFSLLKGTGYFELHEQISESDIRAALGLSSECVEEWLQYSEDKRTTSGWYITRDDYTRYEVGYFEKNGERKHQVYYNDRIDACAYFIKRELEDIRLH